MTIWCLVQLQIFHAELFQEILNRKWLFKYRNVFVSFSYSEFESLDALFHPVISNSNMVILDCLYYSEYLGAPAKALSFSDS